MICISCKSTGDITLKNVTFCNNCFIQKITKRLRQVINTIPKSIILIDCSTQQNIHSYLDLLLPVYKNRHNKQIYLVNTDSNTYNCNLKIIQNDDILSLCEYSIIKLYNLDDLAVKIFECIVQGDPHGTLELVNGNGKIYYPFEGISEVEIEHYRKMNGDQAQIKEGKSLTREFIKNANVGNYSTSFNIVETIKKGAKDQIHEE